MAILTFQKPDKVIMNEADDFHGIFEFRPLQQGFGVTVGNALRRVLLYSLEGYAITSVKIEGVAQEFSSIPGVMEDVIDMMPIIVDIVPTVIVPDDTVDHIGQPNHEEVQYRVYQIERKVRIFLEFVQEGRCFAAHIVTL